jgi:two-component system, NarL family, response regulator LiaR
MMKIEMSMFACSQDRMFACSQDRILYRSVMPTTPISILIVEDDRITRIGLKLMLQRNEEFNIIGEAEDGVAAVSKALDLRPNVILMDIGLPKIDGLEATSQIKSAIPGCKIIMLTSHSAEEDIVDASAAGADGYCLKDVSYEALVEGIKTVNQGGSWHEARIMPHPSTQWTNIKSREL